MPAPPDGRTELARMPARDFFRALRGRAPGDPFLYYTRSVLTSPELAPLRDDVNASAFRTGFDALDATFNASEYTQLWMAPPGLATQAHYDVFHNWYTQLHGEKTFLLASPGQHCHMYPHPALHQSSRQSQLCLAGARCGAAHGDQVSFGWL